MNAKTVAERVSDLRARRKAEGLVKVELWVHQKDATRLKKAADDLIATRAFHAARGRDLPTLEEEQAAIKAMVKRVPKRSKEKQ